MRISLKNTEKNKIRKNINMKENRNAIKRKF